ncbi:competence protein ComG [Geobacillus subterraneus]|uniref:Competence protein ComG n=1 Tax=Geobacillus subterraneus TaxID=129338 RepID=A0A679FHM8_9BACL|nr:competence protein ComG [Geobacillus subterraneus]
MFTKNFSFLAGKRLILVEINDIRIERRNGALEPIEQIASRLLAEAVRRRASDLHLVPRRYDVVVRLRLDGRLTEIGTLTKETAERIIVHFKFLAGMDIGERRRPQSGAMEVNEQGETVYLRLSTLPTLYDESLVIRLLPQRFSLPLRELSLFSHSTARLISLMQQPQGLVLLTGPTGSGKTTTLYTLLDWCQANRQRNVITLEDPVEKRNDRFLQVQINEKAGMTYASGLKAALRHDPDVLMVGEIRDQDTAVIAVRSALSGHFVVSTMHAADAVGAVYRLREFGVSPRDLAETLLAVSAQRLVELRCPLCGDACHLSCRRLGRRRRTAIHELLYGAALGEVIDSLTSESRKRRPAYLTLARLVRKGMALGYLPSRTLELVGGDER